jgi:hypothetical protein
MKMSENELFLHDIRLLDRFLADGTLTTEVQKRHLDSLPDLAEACEEFDLEQPALAKAQVEPVAAPVLAEAAPVGVSAASFAQPFATPSEARAPLAPAQPARSAAGFGAAPQAIPEAAPAASEPFAKPATAVEESPASIPPPTASVDADWGDS